MYKRKSIKFVAILLTLCLLLTAFSGSAIQAQAEELGILAANSQSSTSAITSMSFFFRHFYDSRTFSGKYGSIPGAVSFVNQVYSVNFPATFTSTMVNPPAADTITSLRYCQADVDTICSSTQGCGGYTEHHRDIDNIANALYAWRTRTYGEQNLNIGYLVVLWTDYEDGGYCWYNNENSADYVHESVSYNARVLPNQPVIHIMNIREGVATQRVPHMSFLLAHETAHCIGLDEQYDTLTHKADMEVLCMMDYFASSYVDSSGNIRYPTMEFYEAVIQNPSIGFCSVCKTSITNLLADWISLYEYILG